MAKQANTPESPIDSAIYKVVASVGCGTQLYHKIVTELKKQFTPKKVTLMLYGSTSITQDQLKLVFATIKRFDSKNVLKKEDLI